MLDAGKRVAGALSAALLVVVIGTGAVVLACSGSKTSSPLVGTGAARTATPSPEAAAGEAANLFVPAHYAQSLGAMLYTHEVVVVGRVAKIEGVYYPYAAVEARRRAEFTPPPAGDPKAFTPVASPTPYRGMPATVYNVEVLRTIFGQKPAAGETILVAQEGGIAEGLRNEYREDPLIEVGTTYLFFLGRGIPGPPAGWPPEFAGGYAGFPFSRLVLDSDGQLRPAVDMYADLPAMKELTGLTVHEAAALISAAKPERPRTTADSGTLTPMPTPVVTPALTPAPTPTPTPTPQP